jgi:hypothetical protein
VIRELVLWLLLSACAYRLTRFVTKDTFPAMLFVRDRLAGGWRKPTEGEWRIIRDTDHGPVPFQITTSGDETLRWVNRVKWSPDWFAELITCPWCASAYIAGALTLITDCVIGIQWPWLVGGAVWAVAAPLAARDWP